MVALHTLSIIVAVCLSQEEENIGSIYPNNLKMLNRNIIIRLNGFVLVNLLCAFNPVVSQAQFNTIKVDVASAAAGRIGLAYERTVNNFITIQLGAEYGLFADVIFDGQMDYNLVAFSIAPELRWYPFRRNKDAPHSFFIGETFRYTKYTEQYKALLYGPKYPVEARSKVLSFGLDAGYKFKYKRFSIEPVLGFGLISELQLDDKRDFIPYFYTDGLLVHQNGVKDENGFLRLKLFVGYTFGKKGGYHKES